MKMKVISAILLSLFIYSPYSLAGEITANLNGVEYVIPEVLENTTEEAFYQDFVSKNANSDSASAEDLAKLFIMGQKHEYIENFQHWTDDDYSYMRERYKQLEIDIEDYLEDKGWELSIGMVANIAVGVGIAIVVGAVCVGTVGTGCILAAGLGAKFGVVAFTMGAVSTATNTILEVYEGKTESDIIHTQLAKSKKYMDDTIYNFGPWWLYLDSTNTNGDSVTFESQHDAYNNTLTYEANKKRTATTFNYLDEVVDGLNDSSKVEDWVKSGFVGGLEGVADHFSGGVYSLYHLEQKIVSEGNEDKKREYAELYAKVASNEDLLSDLKIYVATPEMEAKFQSYIQDKALSSVISVNNLWVQERNGKVFLSGYVQTGNGNNPSGTASLILSDKDYSVSFSDIGHTVGSYFKFELAKPQSDETVTITARTNDGLTVSKSISIKGHSNIAGGWNPSAIRVSPGWSRVDSYTGQIIEFIVEGSDSDPYDTYDLDEVQWLVDNEYFELQESDNRDGFSSSAVSNGKGQESMKIKVIKNETFEKQVTARVLTESGNYKDAVWEVRNRTSMAPVITTTTYNGQSNIPLGEHDFEVSIYDEDDNTRTLEWILDGKLLEIDRVSGGNPADSETLRNLEFFERGKHTLIARATDDDDNVSDQIWEFVAGFDTDGFLPTELQFSFAVVPRQWRQDFESFEFRAKQGYRVECEADNPDEIISFLGFYKDDQLLYQKTDSDGDDSEWIRKQMYFESPGDYELRCLTRNTGGDEVEITHTVKVVESDGKSGGAPEITDFFPKANTIYVEPDKSFYFALKLHDYESDVHILEFKVNGELSNRSKNSSLGPGYESLSTRQVNFDGRINPFDDDGLNSGTHEYEFTLIDGQGNRSNTISKTVVITDDPNHSPTVEKFMPKTGGVYMVSGEKDYSIFVYAEDIDGDLDHVRFDLSQVDPVKSDGSPDTSPIEEDSVWGYYELASEGFRPTKSGLVYFQACDRNDNCSSQQSIYVSVSSTRANHPPVLIDYNLREDVKYRWLSVEGSGSGSGLGGDLTVYDPDGDLERVYVKWKSLTTGSTGEINISTRNYFTRDSFEYNDFNEHRAFSFRFDEDGAHRGYEYELTLIAEDSRGNRIEQNNSITVGRVGDFNHSPVTASSTSISLVGGTSKAIQFSVTDEELDEINLGFEDLQENQITIERIGENNLVNFSADSDFSGTGFVTLVWSDGFGGEARTRVDYTVTRPKQLPSFSELAKQVELEDENASFDLQTYLQAIVDVGDYSLGQLNFQTLTSSGLVISGLSQDSLISLTTESIIKLTSDYESGYVIGKLVASDGEEFEQKLNISLYLKNTDTDGDGVKDNDDDFPLDVAASLDSDGDGYPDSWNPGMNQSDSTSSPPLQLDEFPNDASEFTDSDNDGYGDNGDAFPNDAFEWLDTDTDGIGNNTDEDDDNDGLPDAYELLHGLNPNDASDANADSDNDGYTNLQEFVVGSNPTDSTSIIQTLSLKQGWNQVTVASSVQISHLGTATITLGSSYDFDPLALSSVQYYDVASKKWLFYSGDSFLASGIPSGERLESMDVGKAYWIKASKNITYQYAGSPSQSLNVQSLPLMRGHNFIGGFVSTADELLAVHQNAVIVYSYQDKKWFAKSVSNKINADLQEAGIELLENISPSQGVILYIGNTDDPDAILDLTETLGEKVAVASDASEEDVEQSIPFVLSKNKIDATGYEATNASIQCKADWGNDYDVASWEAIKQFYESASEKTRQAFLDSGVFGYVTRNGAEIWSGRRHYFTSRHDGNKPAHYLAHDNIDNYTISLGSWYGNWYAVCAR